MAEWYHSFSILVPLQVEKRPAKQKRYNDRLGHYTMNCLWKDSLSSLFFSMGSPPAVHPPGRAFQYHSRRQYGKGRVKGGGIEQPGGDSDQHQQIQQQIQHHPAGFVVEIPVALVLFFQSLPTAQLLVFQQLFGAGNAAS